MYVNQKLGKMTILAVGAHPDDIELGAGGTVARHRKEGDEVHFLILTYGEESGDKEDRRRESLESAKTLDVNSVTFGDLPDTRVTGGIDTIMKIENLIDKIDPSMVYTHCTKDRHQDHRNTALATFSAARKIAQIFSYESPDTYPNFNPQHYVRVTDTISDKIRALKKYRSQANKNYLEARAIKGLAQFRGYQMGIASAREKVEYAEAFEVVRSVRF